MRLLLFTFLLSALSFGQDRNGISYQALIINPNVEQLPGQDNDHSPLTNTDICLQFHIISSSGNYEYSESQSVTTDAYGMVNLVIGTGTPIGAITWDAVAWSAEAKSLKVDLDITGACTSFTELSNQQLTSVPFALYSPASNTPGPKGDPGDPGEDGDSVYQVWLDAGNTGTEQEFLDSLKGADGSPGDPGANGDSAYQVWLDAGNTGTEQEFLDSLKGADGNPGDPGANGDSAYQVWLDAGNTGTEQEFLDSLKGADGNPGEGTEGKSAYDIWIELGNTGSEQDFIDSLVGPQGEPGQDSSNGSTNVGLDSSLQFKRIETFEEFDFTVPPGELYVLKSIVRFSSNQFHPAFRVEINEVSSLHSAVNREFDGNSSSTAPNYTSPNIYFAPNTRVYSAKGEINNNNSIEGIFTFFVYEYPTNFDVINLTANDIRSGSEYSIPQGKIGKLYQVTRGYNYSQNEIYNSLFFTDNSLNSSITNLPVRWNNDYDPSLTVELNTILPNNWSISSGENPVGHFYTLFLYDENNLINSETPPSTLQVGDEWGGGIVFYIAQPGDPIYVEGEIHGLIAPQNWESNNALVINVNTTAYRTWYEDNPEFTSTGIGDGYLNTEKQYLLQYQNSNSPYNEYSAIGVCYNAVINGYTDWYLPNSHEIWKLRDFQNSTENRTEINFPGHGVGTYWVSGYSLTRGLGNSPIYRVNLGSINRNNGTSGYDYQVKPIRKF